MPWRLRSTLQRVAARTPEMKVPKVDLRDSLRVFEWDYIEYFVSDKHQFDIIGTSRPRWRRRATPATGTWRCWAGRRSSGSGSAGLLDELRLRVVQIVLGGGTALFRGLDPADVALKRIGLIDADGPRT